MKFCCDVMRLAKYIVQKCYQDGHPISNLQLQKILYFLQIMYGRSTEGKELLFQDDFEAWPYGPVFLMFLISFRVMAGVLSRKPSMNSRLVLKRL